MVVPPGYIDVEGSLLVGGTLYPRVFKDGAYFLILDESTARAFY